MSPGRLRDSETFRSLSVRNFRVFTVGQVLSQVGNWFSVLTQTLLVLQLTDSGLALGVLAAAQFGPVLVLGPWAGLVVDRRDKRRLLLIVQSVAMLQSFALAALAFSGHPSVVLIDAVVMVGGMTMAFDNPARRAFVGDLVPPEMAHNAISLNTALMTTARIVGPALAGLVANAYGFGWCFLLDGLSYIAALATLFSIHTHELNISQPAPRSRRQLRDGLGYARRTPAVWIPLAVLMLIGPLSFNFQTVLPLFIVRDLGGSGTTYTWLFTAMSAGAFMGAMLLARRPHITATTVAWSALAFGMITAIVAGAPNQVVMFCVAVLLGASSTLLLTSSASLVQVEAVPEMRGRVLALHAVLVMGSTPIGAPIVGWIAERFGARYALGLAAGAALVAGAWALAACRRELVGAHAPIRDPWPLETAAEVLDDH